MLTASDGARVTYPAHDRPQYPALARAIDALYADLLRALERLRQSVFRALEPAGVKALDDEEVFDYHDASAAMIDRAVELFLTDVAGKDRSRAGFTGSGTADGILQNRAVFAHQVGAVHAADQLDTRPTVQSQWYQPAVQKMLDNAFSRLSANGALRLEGIRDDLHGLLVNATDAGLSPLETGKQMSVLFDQYSGYEFQRLARTETAFAAIAGQRDQYRDLGVQQVEWLLNAGACEICQEYEGQAIDVDDEENMPPAHPACCCDCSPIAPTEEEEATDEESGSGE